MKKVRSGNIKLSKIKHIENSRLRNKDDVADLMTDIKVRGLLAPVGIRTSDNALIYGNRRVKAFENLGYEEIPCEYYDDIDDNELLLTNVVENIKRKDISSIEIGRICKMLVDNGMTKLEIASKLGLAPTRVSSAITAYSVTVGTPFEDLVVFGAGDGLKGRSRYKSGTISEGLIWQIQNTLGRVYSNKISKNHWNVLLRAAEQGKLNTKNLTTLRGILSLDPNKDLERALSVLDKCRIIYAYISFNDDELARAKKEEKINNDIEFIKHIIKSYNKKLIF
jgi:ParB/RepB/Spo0J family partition protein